MFLSNMISNPVGSIYSKFTGTEVPKRKYIKTD